MITESKDFETIYNEVLKRERRDYDDEVVAELPEINREERYFKEWMVRKKSLKRLSDYLRAKNKRLSILDVGCGNGWMTHQLAKIPRTDVIGIDINGVEIEQATRVFAGQTNLKFIKGEISSDLLKDYGFGIIVFASSLQYFRSLSNLFYHADTILVPRGEIHILDTPFYTDKNVHAAVEATKNHFIRIGFPEMNSFYQHHLDRELLKYHPKYLYEPNKFKGFLLNKLGMRNDSPFPWIRIKKYGKALI